MEIKIYAVAGQTNLISAKRFTLADSEFQQLPDRRDRRYAWTPLA